MFEALSGQRVSPLHLPISCAPHHLSSAEQSSNPTQENGTSEAHWKQLLITCVQEDSAAHWAFSQVGPPGPGPRECLPVLHVRLKLCFASLRVLLCEARWCVFHAFETEGAVLGFLVDSVG